VNTTVRITHGDNYVEITFDSESKVLSFLRGAWRMIEQMGVQGFIEEFMDVATKAKAKGNL